MEEEAIFKDAVIIGNGPSAISLSYMLDGNWPYYNGLSHHIDYLQYRLETGKNISLVQQNLEYLSENLEGRSSNPVSVLFDTLFHPQADLGIENPSVISWFKDVSKSIDHVVIGKGVPGGSWQNMEGSTLTISLGTWMDLPEYSIQEWDETMKKIYNNPSRIRQNRATAGAVAEYYHCYVHYQGLSHFFKNNSTVTSVLPLVKNASLNLKNDVLWKTEGYTEYANSKVPFSYISPHVILATGSSDQHNKLGVEGENLSFVLYSLSDLENLIYKNFITSSDHILIVGAGLTAADAIITAKFYGIQISHVFRRSVYDPKLVFNKLSQDIYPEYHKVHQMMKDSNSMHYNDYKAFPCSKIQKILNDGTVVISSCENVEQFVAKVSYVLVLIGSQPDLSFLPLNTMQLGINPNKAIDCKKNPFDINVFTYESIYCPGLYAVGPLVGDNFVRFVQGGALAVANQIINNTQS